MNDECFCAIGGQDPNAKYIFEGIRDGFKIVDDVLVSSYFCQNYNYILDP